MNDRTKSSIEWQKRNPEKAKAHQIVGNAIRTGKLVKGLCEVCGSEKVEGHHEDYSKPLDVKWLCRIHHVEHHKKTRVIKPKVKHPKAEKIEKETIDIEQLATNLETKITLEWYTRTERIYPQLLEALTTAYALGKHDAYNGQRTAARENGKRGGRPKGSKDRK